MADMPPSAHVLEDERLKVAITAAHVKTRETCGAILAYRPNYAKKAFRRGETALPGYAGNCLRCKQKRRFKATTHSSHELPVAGNLLGQCFDAAAPSEVWHSDITCVPTDEGWLGVKDQFTCEVVGYAMSARMTEALVTNALNRAIRYQRPPPGLSHHSGRGSQYCAQGYQQRLLQQGLRSSMSAKGNCHDNAPMESFFGSLKNELIHHRRFETRADAEAAIREYIEIFYNRQLRHSRLGNVPPAVFAQTFRKQQQPV